MARKNMDDEKNTELATQMKEENKHSQLFGSSQLKPVGITAYLTNWSTKIHFLKDTMIDSTVIHDW